MCIAIAHFLILDCHCTSFNKVLHVTKELYILIYLFVETLTKGNDRKKSSKEESWVLNNTLPFDVFFQFMKFHQSLSCSDWINIFVIKNQTKVNNSNIKPGRVIALTSYIFSYNVIVKGFNGFLHNCLSYGQHQSFSHVDNNTNDQYMDCAVITIHCTSIFLL